MVDDRSDEKRRAADPTGIDWDDDEEVRLMTQRRSRGVNPGAILLGLLGLSLFVGLLAYGLMREAELMTVEQRMEVQKNIFILPAADQLPKWRELATHEDEEMRSEALTQLALLDDEQGIKLAVAALKDPSHKVRGTCAQVLAYYGSEAADLGRPALLEALEGADASDERQIVWALVALGEPKVFDRAMEMYSSGELTTVERLEGGRAFDPTKIARLVPLDRLAGMAGHSSGAIRQLVATILSENADKAWTEPLVKLVQDGEVEVAREAAPGLGKIGDEAARGPLVAALAKAQGRDRDRFVEALRDGIGGEGLVLALDTVDTQKEETTWFQTKQLFDMMYALGDPRTGDALLAWVERTKPHIHWETEAGLILGSIGDVRGAALIARRMGVESKDAYDTSKFWQHDAGGHLSKSDNGRIFGARMLADLAVMLPDKRKELLDVAEEPVLGWAKTYPQPNANALRFLAAAGSKKGLEPLRDWAFPGDPLPKDGASGDFPRPFATAQSAMRYIGWARDPQSYDKLIDQYGRKTDKKMDITMDGLVGTGRSMLAFTLRALTVGASHGLAQWGPVEADKAEKAAMEFIEDELWIEQARMVACESLAWFGKKPTFDKVIERVREHAGSTDPKKQFIARCYAATLARKPQPNTVGMMIELMGPGLDVNTLQALGHAIGVAGLKEVGEAGAGKLMEMVKDPALRNAAALALVLGGDADTAARTVAMFAEKDLGVALDALKDSYFQAFGYWSHADLDSGNIYRWIDNAKAIQRVRIGGAPQLWAVERLQAQFANLNIDNGPHSETRVVLRHRILQSARQGTPEQQAAAVSALEFMKEFGTLMALAGEEGEVGALAAKALHALRNPFMSREDASKLKALLPADKQ